MFKKTEILGLLIFVIGIAMNYLYFFVFRAGAHDIGYIISAFLVGYYYTKKFGYEISKYDRLKTTCIFLAIYLVFTLLLTFDILTLLSIAFVIPLLLLECFIIYWILGFSGRSYLKYNKKKSGG